MFDSLPAWLNGPTLVGLAVFALLIILRCGVLWIALSAVIALAVATDTGGLLEKLSRIGGEVASVLWDKAAEKLSESILEGQGSDQGPASSPR